MSEVTTHYQSAASLLRVQGILSIIFGILGILIGIGVVFLLAFATPEYSSYQTASSFILAFVGLVFFVLPHVYLLIAGIHLINKPSPSVAKTLVIINLIVGVLMNLVIMIFAIINLVQIADYEHGYKKVKE